MKFIFNQSIEIVVGKESKDIQPFPIRPYAGDTLAFLSELSRRLLKSPLCRTYPDIAGFAYWCRYANLARLDRNFGLQHLRIGRGLSFHITPANVPVNFAFSLAFGMLAGNSNIVRISNKDYPQVTIICAEIAEIFANPQYSRIASMNRIIRYPSQGQITEELSKICHSRVLWGGDSTIKTLRAMETSPRCVDVCFPDRYSICVLGSDSIIASSDKILGELILGFYNDVFLLDQNACSSPHLILWQGSPSSIVDAKNKFWGSMKSYLKTKPPGPAIHSIEKYIHLCRTAISLPEAIFNMDQSNNIYRVALDTCPENIDKYRGQHGFFFETIDNDFSVFSRIVGERYQTVTYFGVDPQDIVDKVFSSGLLGVDRVVPVGRALDIGTFWDGYDLVGSLSRIISVN